MKKGDVVYIMRVGKGAIFEVEEVVYFDYKSEPVKYGLRLIAGTYFMSYTEHERAGLAPCNGMESLALAAKLGDPETDYF